MMPLGLNQPDLAEHLQNECTLQDSKTNCDSLFIGNRCVWLHPQQVGTTGKASKDVKMEQLNSYKIGIEVAVAVFAQNEGSVLDPYANNICDITNRKSA